jgi:hypothetical protein
MDWTIRVIPPAIVGGGATRAVVSQPLTLMPVSMLLDSAGGKLRVGDRVRDEATLTACASIRLQHHHVDGEDGWVSGAHASSLAPRRQSRCRPRRLA